MRLVAVEGVVLKWQGCQLLLIAAVQCVMKAWRAAV